MWDLSSPTNDQTMSPALKGGFLTAGPPGKSCIHVFPFLKSWLNLLPYNFCFSWFDFFSSLPRGWTHTPCMGRCSLKHWTTRKVPPPCILVFSQLTFKKEVVNINTTVVQRSFGSPSYSNLRRKTNKRIPDRKRSKALTVCWWHDTVHRKP